MARDTKRTSILEGVKAGQIIVEGSDETSKSSGNVADSERGTGPATVGSGTENGAGDNDAIAAGHDDAGGLDAADAFGPDPEFEPGTGTAGTVPVDAAGRDASKPRGKASPNYGTKTKAKTNLGFIEKTLGGIHSILVVVTKDDLFELSDDEIRSLAEALSNVQDQYDLRLDPKTQAWLELAGIGAAIYGPRIAAKVLMSARKPKEVEEKQEKPAPKTAGNIVTPQSQMNGQAKGEGPMGAFVPSMMFPLGHAGGGEE